MDYLNVLGTGSLAMMPGGAALVYQGIERHWPILTVVGVAIVAAGVLVVAHLWRRQHHDARDAGV